MVKYPERVFPLTRYPTKTEPPQARLHNQTVSSGKVHKIMSRENSINLPDFHQCPDAIAIDLDGTLLNSQTLLSGR
jgi:hypothetical protein